MAHLDGLEGRTALVTGAGEDFGRVIALALSQAGANVAIHAVAGQGNAEAVATEARALGGKAAVATGDVTDPGEAEAIVAQARKAFGPIDIFIHCVGVRPHSAIAESTVKEWHQAIDTNCSSFFYLARHLLPDMTARQFGRLVSVTVALDDQTRPLHGAIAAARAGLRELVKVIAVETAAQGVTSNLVSISINENSKPELLKPEMLRKFVPAGRPGKLEEIAAACLYLCSRQAAYVTGQTLHVDGGFTL